MFDFFNAAISSFYNTLATIIWIVGPVFLAAVFFEVRLYQKRIEFISKTDWVLLELKPPKDLVKTPKSMEQVFAAFYGIYSFGIKWHDKYLDGKVEQWLSLEMVGRGGGIHFYIRVPKERRNLAEAAIYAQYPEVEITEVSDYVEEMPLVLPNDTWDLWGIGYTLVKPSPYPIRTYPYFEEVKEEKRIDPISNVAEAMSKLKDDEMAWIQMIISPVGPQTGQDFKKEGDEEIRKMIEGKEKEAAKKKEEQQISLGMWRLTPPEQDAIKAIAAKVSKLPFRVSFRFVYIDKKSDFTSANPSAITSSFHLVNTRDLNAFKPDRLITVYSGFPGRVFPWFKKLRVAAKKRRMYDFYRKRRFGYTGYLSEEKDLPILNTEELATLYHFPAGVVKAPKLQTVYSKKGEPPINLPVSQS